ncbi:MAG: DUF3842 family protein [Bacillota bacterium]|nr:DUF3842 family protein [Bacillota bacterium]
MIVAVIDGQGGGIGRTLVEKLLEAALPGVELLALGTNSAATSQMMKAGAREGATGENAIVVNAGRADVIVGVTAILAANSMMGELSPAMARAIGESRAHKVLIPVNRCGIYIAGVEDKGLRFYIDAAVRKIRELAYGN